MKENQINKIAEPGKLADWVEHMTEQLFKFADQGKLLNSSIVFLRQEFEVHFIEYTQPEKYSTGIVQEAEYAARMLIHKIDVIEEKKSQFERWSDGLKITKNTNHETRREMGQQITKYILIGYGVAFVTLLGGLFANKSNAEWNDVILQSVTLYSIGFFLAILGMGSIFLNLQELIHSQQEMLINRNINSEREKQSAKKNSLGMYVMAVAGIFLVIGLIPFAFPELPKHWNALTVNQISEYEEDVR